jgi:hypothetical protein
MQGVTEAALEVRTEGGQLHIGKTKVTAADISTSGADITGSLTAGSVTPSCFLKTLWDVLFGSAFQVILLAILQISLSVFGETQSCRAFSLA